jgi:uncharacterized protein YjbI with pentapeptide repeats
MPVSPETLDRLNTTDAAGRADVVRGLIADHPEHRLELSAASGDGAGAMLNGVDLAGADLQSAKLRGVSLRSANLQGANLKASDLRGAKLGAAKLDRAMVEEADLQNADLIAASLRGASLGGANLKGALLEDADLRQAGLRFAVFQNAFLENAKLEGADLWGSNCAGAVFSRANLRGAILTESNLEGADLSGADLRDARLDKTNLKGVNLDGADLRGATLPNVNLREASLRHANLQGVDLSTCDVTHVHISGAVLERTRLRRGQIGGAIGEELASRFEEAGHGYLALEQDFAALGDGDAASWAYRKRRRMQKLTALQMARQRRQQGHTKAALPFYAKFGRFQVVEWVCDYGESAPRVLLSILGLFLLFTLAYGVTGAVVRSGHGPTRNPLQLAAYSLLVMTTSGTSAAGLQPRNEWVLLLSGLQAFLGIALTGLLGFVVGNRLRR